MVRTMYSLVIGLLLLAACRESSRALKPEAIPLPPRPAWLSGVTVADEPAPYDAPSALEVYDHLHTLGVRAIALTPAAYLTDLHRPLLRWRDRAHVREGIAILHQRGFAVMIKPYIWSHVFYTEPGTWTGVIEMQNDSDWRAFFATYQNFILQYARIAEDTHAELFSIGLEYPKTFCRTAEWDSLIRAVRSVFHGPITYASTGVDEAEQVPFWDKMDVMGVDAFLPLTDNKYPVKQELCDAWNAYISRLNVLYLKYHKPIVFTEAGYKSCVGAACKPWEWNEHTPHPLDLQQQSVCYDALATSLFDQPWFSGIFWWKYFTSMKIGGPQDNDFTPMGKPAEKMMGNWFSKMTRVRE